MLASSCGAQAYGGGIAAQTGVCTLIDSAVTRCAATAVSSRCSGGGVGVEFNAQLTCINTTIEHCTVASPHPSSGGGGLAVTDNAFATLANGTAIRFCVAPRGVAVLVLDAQVL